MSSLRRFLFSEREGSAARAVSPEPGHLCSDSQKHRWVCCPLLLPCAPITRLCLPQNVSFVSADTPWLNVDRFMPSLTQFHPFLCTFVGAGWRGRAAPGVHSSSGGTQREFPARRNVCCRRFKSQSKTGHLLHFDFKRSQVPFPNYSALRFQRQGADRMCNNPALFTACNLWCGFCSRCQGVTFQRELNSKH